MRKPLKVGYHVKAPEYAQRTAKRILFEPLMFQHGAAPMFSAPERRYGIEFHHAWKETDRVVVKLPAGFVVDSADNPGSMDFGKPGSYTLKMGKTDKNEVVSIRELTFGKDGIIVFPRETYQQLKHAFDAIHDHDSHVITLRQADGATASGGKQ